MLANYPNLRALVTSLDEYLRDSYPDYFSDKAKYPLPGLKAYKVIHDNLWGTNRFSWRELSLIDSPLLQRLRQIHQTGLAHYVYPSARHSRFEHSLGVVTVASRAFDALQQRNLGKFLDLGKVLNVDPYRGLAALREELRLAALLHDTGHSLYSHTSELVYSNIPLLKNAASELGQIVGRKKGVGEVISFCLAKTKAISDVLERAKDRLLDDEVRHEALEIDLDNVSLLIVGRSKHPFFQFVGDIISSDLDADKLDYLLRDAAGAGLPLRYDLERYLYTVTIVEDRLLDDGHLERLYNEIGTKVESRESEDQKFDYYPSYVLRLPPQAMSTLEQIVICKFMLYSYIYHHPKVRAAEGLLAIMLNRAKGEWDRAGEDDVKLVRHFLDLNDSSLESAEFKKSEDQFVEEYGDRVRKRLLPRVVFDFVQSMASHAQEVLLKDFFSILIDPQRRGQIKRRFEKTLGGEILKIDPALGRDWNEALLRTGAWLDIPAVPKFENVSLLVGARPLASFFPVDYWIQAYVAHRYHVRVFGFPEFQDVVTQAAKRTCKEIMKIDSDEFYEQAQRKRK